MVAQSYEDPDIATVRQPFQVSGFKFSGLPVGTSGGTVTWALADLNFFGRFQFDSMLDESFATAIDMAFDAWSSVADIEFIQVADDPDVDIRFGLEFIDGSGGTLAVAETFFDVGTGETLYSDIYFDLNDTFFFDEGGSDPDLFIVSLHEIGHAIGLDHEDDVLAVMNSFFNPSLTGLLADDIAGIQFLYGEISPGDQLEITGDNGGNVLIGDDSRETFIAMGGDDLIQGEGGADLIYGNQGADTIYGNPGGDVVYGGQDGDTVYGGQDGDTIYGGLGNDIIYGNLGDDDIFANQGDDVLFGGQSSDLIHGGQGNDEIIGGAGDDLLVGGQGADILTGGEGADIFFIDDLDVITDFGPGDSTLPAEDWVFFA
jgi:Ca2+-binding RTX toxin-like protein